MESHAIPNCILSESPVGFWMSVIRHTQSNNCNLVALLKWIIKSFVTNKQIWEVGVSWQVVLHLCFSELFSLFFRIAKWNQEMRANNFFLTFRIVLETEHFLHTLFHKQISFVPLSRNIVNLGKYQGNMRGFIILACKLSFLFRKSF